jgi:hypothetical protein
MTAGRRSGPGSYRDWTYPRKASGVSSRRGAFGAFRGASEDAAECDYAKFSINRDISQDAPHKSIGRPRAFRRAGSRPAFAPKRI